MTSNVVVLRDARKAWVSVASRSNQLNEIFIFSPYITGSVVDEIIENSDG